MTSLRDIHFHDGYQVSNPDYVEANFQRIITWLSFRSNSLFGLTRQNVGSSATETFAAIENVVLVESIFLPLSPWPYSTVSIFSHEVSRDPFAPSSSHNFSIVLIEPPATSPAYIPGFHRCICSIGLLLCSLALLCQDPVTRNDKTGEDLLSTSWPPGFNPFDMCFICQPRGKG